MKINSEEQFVALEGYGEEHREHTRCYEWLWRTENTRLMLRTAMVRNTENILDVTNAYGVEHREHT